MAVMLAINASTALSAPARSMDTSFGNSGNVTTDFGSGEDSARGIAIQLDGKPVAAGSAEDRSGPGRANGFALARCNSDGTLELSAGHLELRHPFSEILDLRSLGRQQDA